MKTKKYRKQKQKQKQQKQKQRRSQKQRRQVGGIPLGRIATALGSIFATHHPPFPTSNHTFVVPSQRYNYQVQPFVQPSLLEFSKNDERSISHESERFAMLAPVDNLETERNENKLYRMALSNQESISYENFSDIPFQQNQSSASLFDLTEHESDLNFETYNAFSQYQLSTYRYINSLLRYGLNSENIWIQHMKDDANMIQSIQGDIIEMETEINRHPLPHDIIVYRGLGACRMDEQDDGSVIFEDAAFMSTSLNPKIAQMFYFDGEIGSGMQGHSYPCFMELTVVKGTPHIYLGPEQEEVLFGPNMKFYMTELNIIQGNEYGQPRGTFVKATNRLPEIPNRQIA